MINAAEQVLDRLHLRRHSAETEVKVEDPETKVKIKERNLAPAPEMAPEHDVHPVTPPATDPAGPKIKVKVKDPGASGITEKIKIREVAPGQYEVEEKYKGPDGKTHVRTRAAVGDEIPGAAAAAHAPGVHVEAGVRPPTA